MKTIETLTGVANGAGVYDETQHISNAVIWEHPDQSGYFINSLFGPAGLKLAKGSTKAALKFADLFNLVVSLAPELLPTLPAVTATPASGVHPLTVALACAQAGAEIRYTVDGSTPTGASTLYTVPIAVAAAETIKAKAFKTYWQPSALASFVYT